jgi:3-deoxy-D-manno-octulosonate 8-phosphate phosphatase (KDO 8-P phosphatase)
LNDSNNPDVSTAILQRASKISLILMDVDGVLTDGRLYYVPGPKGKLVEFKAFNSQDGLGFHMLNGLGTIKTGVISGRESPSTTERARLLKFSFVYQGLLEKEAPFNEILAKAQVKDEQVAFIGDDFSDVPVMLRAGLACAVADARPEVREIAHYVTEACGGHGAVREVIELILKAQNQWNPILEKYRLKTTAAVKFGAEKL